LDDTAPTPLMRAYLEKRDELTRFFTTRLGSTAAAEDLVQDIFLKVAATSPDAPVRNPGAYLYRLGSNLMLDNLRAGRRALARDSDWRRHEVDVVAGQDVARLPRADDAAAAKQRLEQIVDALQALPPQVRAAFRLHKFEGLSHAETAAALRISRSAVEKHVSAALKHLVQSLGE